MNVTVYWHIYERKADVIVESRASHDKRDLIIAVGIGRMGEYIDLGLTPIQFRQLRAQLNNIDFNKVLKEDK